MREWTDGSTAIVRGALHAGCTFFAGYPITPASPILMSMLAELPKTGGVAIQAEDEIAAIGMCIGAAMSGSRAMTATSGPGISLYSENLGLAIMGEVPLVVVDVQRLGPATGGATTVGQGDLQFVRWGTSGGFPVIALAPSTAAEGYGVTRRAFDLAERFRCPVFVLTDKELNLTTTTVDPSAYEPVPVGTRVQHAAGQPFTPYKYEPAAGVPPMAHVGDGTLVRFTGSTHDERAFLTKDPATVGKLNAHLCAKIDAHAAELEWAHSDLQDGADTLVIAFGVTSGALRAAVKNLRARGRRVSSFVPISLWPVPERGLAAALRGVRRVVVAELNPGLFAREVRLVARDVEVVSVTRMDGELVSPTQIEEACR